MHPVTTMYIPHIMMRLLDGVDVARLYREFALIPEACLVLDGSP